MLKLSRNNQNIKMFGVPPNILPLVIYIYFYRGYFVIGYYYITTCHSKQLPVGLMVLSDGMLHFLKIEKIFNSMLHLPKLSCGFNRANENHTVCGGFFIPVLPTRCRCLRSTSTPTGYSSLRRRGRSMIGSSSNQGETAFISYTGEPCYNRDLGTMKITLLYQDSHHIRVIQQRHAMSLDQQN